MTMRSEKQILDELREQELTKDSLIIGYVRRVQEEASAEGRRAGLECELCEGSGEFNHGSCGVPECDHSEACMGCGDGTLLSGAAVSKLHQRIEDAWVDHELLREENKRLREALVEKSHELGDDGTYTETAFWAQRLLDDTTL